MPTTPPTAEHKPGFIARLCAEFKRLAVLVVIGGLLVIAGKYYCFDRLDEEIRAHIEKLLASHYQGLSVSVRSARRVAGKGVEIRGIRLAEVGDQGALLAEIDEIFAECDTRLPDFLTQPPKITSLRVHRLKLRAERKTSGNWNLALLLPLPPSQSAKPPVATITDGALEIVDSTQLSESGACALAVRNMELTIEPELTTATDAANPATTLLHIRGTLAGDHVERVSLDGRLNPQTGRWEMRGDVEGLEFSPRLRAALPSELSSSLAPLSSVRGRTYFGFHAERDAKAAEPLQFVVHGRIAEGRIDDARLPEPLTDVEANIRCDNHGVLVEDLTARCGTTQLSLKASAVGYDSRGQIEVELTARQLQLERLPTKTLPPQVRETWNRFHPRGLADVSGKLKYDGQQWQPDLTIECHDLSFVYDRFPYRLTDGSGTILVKPDAVFARLRTSGGGQTVNCRADVRHPGRYFTGWIEVQAEGPIPIDEKMLAAMETPLQRIVRGFQPRGSAACYVRMHREPGETVLHRHVRVDLHDCRIQHEKFAYPIDKVSGQLELIDDAWTFRNLSGRNDSAAIVGEGTWRASEPEGKQLMLQFHASDVPLADELRQALPAGTQRLWSNLRPRGNIDQLMVGLKYGSESRQWSIAVQAKKRDATDNVVGRAISLEPACFPYQLDNLTGDFNYDNGSIRLVNLHAAHGKADIAAEGTCQVLPEGGCRLELTRLSADHVEVDQDLLAAFPTGLKDSLSRFPLQGQLNLDGAIAILVPPQPDAPPQLHWNLSLDVEGGRLATATPLEHLHGGVKLQGQRIGDTLFSRGELTIDSAIVRGVQLTKLTGPFLLNDKRLLFGAYAQRPAEGRPPQSLTAKIFSGLLSLDGEMLLGSEGTFGLQAKLENADLAQISQQMTAQQRTLTGKVFGMAKLGGTIHGMHTWRGDGQVRLRDADIYELPVMINLLKLLSIQRPDRTAFTTSNIDFRIEGDDLALQRIDFNGDVISLKGEGRMNGQRELDLRFHPIFGREERHLAIFRPLLGETGREIMLIEVTGSLDQPEVRRRVFPRLDEQLQQLFPELVRDETPPTPASSLLQSPRTALERLLPRR